jgi:hypothetical protein
MIQYHKIQNIFTRDTVTNKLIIGQYKDPYFEYLKNLEWVATEKVDGTNIRIIWRDNKFEFKGKSDRAEFHKGMLEALQNLTKDWDKFMLEKFPDQEVCFYGEGYGAGIQKGGVYRPDKSFILFDIYSKGVWFNIGATQGIAEKLGCDHVPIIATGSLEDMVRIVQTGLTSKWGDFESEGLIVKPAQELFDNRGNRIILKIKTCDF